MRKMNESKLKWKIMKQAELIMTLFIFLAGIIPAASASKILTLPTDTIIIQEEAFYGDKSIKEVTLPEGITRIENLGFAGSSVDTINFPASLEYIADNAFEGCELETIDVQKGTYAYEWCRNHGYITIYRALLIGEETFWYDRGNTRFRADVNNMAAMLGRVRGPKGGKYKVNTRFDRSYNEIRADIQNCLGDAMIQDVSLFFISTHGNSSGDGELGMPDFSSEEYLPFATLASWLTNYVQGEVIVIIQSCGSGSAIYNTPGGKLNGKAENSRRVFDPDAFNAAAIKAFEEADRGIVRYAEENSSLKKNSTGDLRIPKYYVLTASNHQELSFGMEYEDASLSYNFFTKWLIEGIGTSYSPADASPQDGMLTLEELYQYVSLYDTTPMNWKDSEGKWHTDYQHVQRYPAGSQYQIFGV